MNATTKKDPYPLPFTYEVLNYSWKAWCFFFFRWIFWISLNIYSTRRQIQNKFCNKSFYLGSNVF
jgi:hypothetical protein